MRLLPHDASFFTHFEQQGKKTVEGCRAFLEMVENPTQLDAKAERVKQIEHECDEITHAVVEGLHKTFITPIDRNDIYTLITRMDDIMDLVEAAADRLSLYDMKVMTKEAGDLARCLVSSAEHVLGAVTGIRTLGKPNGILEHCIEINRLENVADTHPRGQRWPDCSATRRTRSPSSSGRRSTRRSSRRPTAARTSRTSSRASSSRTVDQVPPMVIIVAIVVIALAFDYINGFHDAANSIATVVSTRVLTPRAAVIWAAFFNFIAFVVFPLHVAHTIGKGIIDPSIINDRVLLSALGGAIAWNLITWFYGPAVQLVARAGGRLDRGGPLQGGHGRHPERGGHQDRDLHRRVAGPGDAARRRHDGAGRVGLPARAARPHRSLVSAATARLLGALQPGPRGQRRPEDDGDHRGDADRQGEAELTTTRSPSG